MVGVLPRFAARSVAVVVLVQAAVLTVVSGRYGFHRDELYFVATAHHLAWGYTDQPPITPVLAWLSTSLFGETPAGLRVVATLLSVATTVVVALIARETGGRAPAQVLAAAGAALSSFLLVSTHMLSTNSVDLLAWTAVALLAARLLRTGDGRWWLAVGAAAGVGLDNKWLLPLLLAALGVGVLVFGPRSVLRTWWLAAGVGLAVLLVAPVLIWQAAHGFPLLTVAGGISTDDGNENRSLFVPMQLVYALPVLIPVWLGGVVRPWRDAELRWAKAVSASYPVVCAVLLVVGGKPYYAAPLLLVLTAIGAQPAVHWFTGVAGTAWRVTTVLVAVVSVAVSVLVSLPLLPVSALAPALALNKEQGEQIGWPALVDDVSQVWQRIPAADRPRAVILARNYGQAGAIDRYGPERGLPRAYSGHMSYADWGAPADSMTGPVLLVGNFRSFPVFTGCQLVSTVDNKVGVDNDEQGTVLVLCTGTYGSWSQVWPRLRVYY